eukprot:301351-Rhodomonas_salina.1
MSVLSRLFALDPAPLALSRSYPIAPGPAAASLRSLRPTRRPPTAERIALPRAPGPRALSGRRARGWLSGN